ncbi:MAG: hypothetical protein ACON3Z_14890 [Bradymonadia bacterium]
MAKQIIALSIASLLTVCVSSLTGVVLAQETSTKPALKLNEGQFSPRQKAQQKERNRCKRDVLKLAKGKNLRINKEKANAQGMIISACARARFDAKAAIQIAYKEGAIIGGRAEQTGGTADQRTECQETVRMGAKSKGYQSPLKPSALAHQVGVYCEKNQFVPKTTLQACIEAGLFTKAKQKPMASKTAIKTSPTQSKNKKLKTCSLKVKYQLKTKKLYPRRKNQDKAKQIEQACVKARFNAKRSFAMVKRYFSKKRPSSAVRKGRRIEKGQQGLAKDKASASGGGQPAAPASKMKQCKASVWDIAKAKQLRPTKGKSAVNKRILETCRLNAYAADVVFKKLEKLFSDGSDVQTIRKGQQRPESKKPAGHSISTFTNRRSLSTQTFDKKTTQPKSAKRCHSQVAQWAAKKDISALRGLDRNARQMRIQQACNKAMNDPARAQKHLR